MRDRACVVVLALASVSVALPASAQRGVVTQRVVGLVNPVGAEHMIAVGVRAPLGDQDELLFGGAHVEAGLVDYTSPIDARYGAYLQVSPLAFLVLRAELTGISMWSLGMDGAGFFPVEGYDADIRGENLAAGTGGEATGTNVQLSAIVQGAVQLGPVRPIVWSQLAVDHETLGDAPYHFSPRYGVVLRREDWMIGSSTMALLEIALEPGVLLRVGAYDDVRYVPGSGSLSNQVGPIVALALERVDPSIPEILFLLRAATYTDHPTLEGQWTGLAGVIIRYDLGALP